MYATLVLYPVDISYEWLWLLGSNNGTEETAKKSHIHHQDNCGPAISLSCSKKSLFSQRPLVEASSELFIYHIMIFHTSCVVVEELFAFIREALGTTILKSPKLVAHETEVGFGIWEIL